MHILPGDAGYGSALLGYHFYSWSFLCFAAAILASAIMLLFDGQFRSVDDAAPADPAPGMFGKVAIWLVIAITLANIAGVLLECGLASCPDNPVRYEMLQGSG